MIITWIKRLFLALSFLALITTNVLTLTSTAFNAALSTVMSTALGVQTVYTKHKAATKRFGSRLVKRTKRVAKRSVAAIPGEAIPIIGPTLLIGVTAYELAEACNSIKELDELYMDMGIADENPDDMLHTFCGSSSPNAEKLSVGERCRRDGQCDSGECKKLRCATRIKPKKDIGHKCVFDGDCKSDECKRLKCVLNEYKTGYE